MPIHLKWRIPLVYLVLVGETSQRFKMPSTSFLSTTISGYAFKFLLKYISKNLFIYIITHIHIYTSTFVRASSCQFVNLFISRGVCCLLYVYTGKKLQFHRTNHAFFLKEQAAEPQKSNGATMTRPSVALLSLPFPKM